jgi:hypothetical protein
MTWKSSELNRLFVTALLQAQSKKAAQKGSLFVSDVN